MPTAPHHRVVIVGTGFSGLGMAVRLARRDEQDFVLLEKADDVGGTWRDNRYPGCACDVPSRLYSFSFDQNPEWSREYAPAPEIWAYLRDVADRYAVRDHVVFGADLARAEYDEAAERWTLTAADGRQWTCESLVLGVGGLHEPAWPDIPGLQDFAGRVVHTARWPADDGLDGGRVAVIGTGASSIQVVPALAPRAARTTVFQRTPAWILPRFDRPWSERRHRTFRRYPVVQRAVRWATYWRFEAQAPMFVRFPSIGRVAERISLRHLARSVRDPAVRASLTPDYRLGCKRVLFSGDYWAAFDRSDVDLVTEAISHVEADALVTADGRRHPADAIVLGTGFSTRGSFDRIDIRGLDGRTLAQAWADQPVTHLGITVAGFPELYLLLGPNTGLGHTSVVLMSEFATHYVDRAIQRSGGGARVTRPAAQQAFMSQVAARSRRTVWMTGCHSWYLDARGRNTALWPGSTVGYWWRTRRPDDSVFEPVAERSRPATKETLDA
jgi:cation diffusion facilitator CzcD-associated flavoprotein CzcO